MYFATSAQLAPFFIAILYGKWWLSKDQQEKQQFVAASRSQLNWMIAFGTVFSFFPAIWNTFRIDVPLIVSTGYVFISKAIFTGSFLAVYSIFSSKGEF